MFAFQVFFLISQEDLLLRIDKSFIFAAMRQTFLLLLTFLTFVSLSAESVALTFADLIDIALENNPETKAVWWKAKRAEANVGSAKSAYYPRIDLETSVTHGREFKYINGPDINYTYLSADFILGWMLYDFGERRASYEAAKCALVAADWQYNLALQKVILEVLSKGYSVLHAEETLEAARISCQEAAFMFGAAQELYYAGLSPISDVDSSEAAYFQMQIQMLQQKQLLDMEKGKLALALGLSAFEKLELEKMTQVPDLFCQVQNELFEQAVQKRADFAVRQAKVAEAKSLEKKTAAEFRPKVFFSAKGGGDRAVHDRANGLHYGVALHFDVPLFDGFETIHRLQMRRADVQISQEELSSLNLEISFEVLKYSNEMLSLQEMYGLSSHYLKSAEKAYLGKMEMYKAGEEKIFEVSAALMNLAKARILFSDIKTRWLASSAYLAFSRSFS